MAALFAGLSEASGFVLAGGAALIARGEIDRLTRDLDFFATDTAQVDQVVPIFVATVRDAGLTVVEVQVASGFARLVVADGDDRTGVDIAADARLLPADRTALLDQREQCLLPAALEVLPAELRGSRPTSSLRLPASTWSSSTTPVQVTTVLSRLFREEADPAR